MFQKVLFLACGVSVICASCSSLKKEECLAVRLVGAAEVETGTNTLWVPLRIENKTNATIYLDSFLSSLPSSRSFTIESDQPEALFLSDGICTNSRSGEKVELKPHSPVYCKLPYVIHKARPGNYHCHLKVYRHPEWGVDFDISIPSGYEVGDHDLRAGKGAPIHATPTRSAGGVVQPRGDYKDFIINGWRSTR